MIFAVLPAAGKSTRMGRPKLALPLGQRTVLEHVIAALRAGGAETVLVVLAPHVRELTPLVDRAGALSLLLPADTPDMRTTVQRGLDWLEQRFQPRPNDGWFLVPADQPLLHEDVVNQLLQVREQDPSHSIFVPVCDGKRGHPALLGWHHVAGIRQIPEGRGLNEYIHRHAAETREVEVQSAVILRDLDTPEDYATLCAEWDQ